MNVQSVEQIWQMAYPDFVAFIDQDNSPPGGEPTISWWIERAGISADSHVLDLACNTGFSSRTISRRTGCTGAGLDLSAMSIAAARAASIAPIFDGRLDYRIGDAASLPWSAGEFSHVVAGCCFGFISDRERALTETARVLRPGGKLCVSALAYIDTPPASLLDDLQQCLGYRPAPARTVSFWREFFALHFDVAESWVEPLPINSEDELRDAAVAHMLRHQHRFDGLSVEQREATLVRLFRDRLVFNENRRYQTCCRWVLNVRSN